jgi:hypothetical protein
MHYIRLTGFDDALIAVGIQNHNDVAVYDYDKCIDILMERDGMTEEEAIEWLDDNIIDLGSVQATSPVFVTFDHDFRNTTPWYDEQDNTDPDY